MIQGLWCSRLGWPRCGLLSSRHATRHNSERAQYVECAHMRARRVRTAGTEARLPWLACISLGGAHRRRRTRLPGLGAHQTYTYVE